MNLPAPLLAVTGIDLAMIMALSGMLLGLIFGLSGMYFAHRRTALWHETARLALEKGQPMPPMPAEMPTDPWANAATDSARAELREHIRQQRIRGMLIGGLVNLAVGAGLFLALRELAPPAAYFAAIPGFIGVALILAAAVDAATGKKHS